MVFNFRVFKKQSPNGKITIYLGKRDFVDHISGVEPIGKRISIFIHKCLFKYIFQIVKVFEFSLL